MHIQHINPASVYNSLNFGFSQATVNTKDGVMHISGQVAWDAQNTLVGADDLGLQARQALANLRHVLADQGLDASDLLRLQTYVVNHSPEKIGPIAAEMMAFYGDVLPAANTWIGVQALVMPEFLIEIEATALLRV